MLLFRGGVKMNIRTSVPCLLLLLLLSACDFSLGLDIMNAANGDIDITIGSESQRVAPGLSFHGTFPAPEDHAELTVSDDSCRYRYVLPDLNQEPWHSLIGKSFKLRWFGGGRMIAYPPTPDVRIHDNPQRTSTDEVRTIRPAETTCR
jgi:hypothetical protein